MAQSTFHFGIGMLCATVCTIKSVLQAWCATRPTGSRQFPNIPPEKRQSPKIPPGGRQSPAAAAAPPNAPSLSTAIARWCLWSYAIGTLAIVPAVARRLTGIEPTHPLWNVFVAYPLIDRLPLPSIILGELLLGAIIGAQYGIILLAIYRLSRAAEPKK